MIDNEKRAHDLAMLYELLSAISEDQIVPQELILNYEKSYKEFLQMLSS